MKTELNNVHMINAYIHCPICRDRIPLTVDFVRKYNIPSSSFQLDNVIDPMHVEAVYQATLQGFTKTRFDRLSDIDVGNLSKDQCLNIVRAVFQNNAALLSWWLEPSRLSILNIVTVTDAFFDILSRSEREKVKEYHVLKMQAQILQYLKSHGINFGDPSMMYGRYGTYLDVLITYNDEHITPEVIESITLFAPILHHFSKFQVQTTLLRLSEKNHFTLLNWWRKMELPIITSLGLYSIDNIA
ncbi:MAG: hypothetical protein EOP45_20785, partial [Sphingobacteriaceae bacterium]